MQIVGVSSCLDFSNLFTFLRLCRRKSTWIASLSSFLKMSVRLVLISFIEFNRKAQELLCSCTAQLSDLNSLESNVLTSKLLTFDNNVCVLSLYAADSADVSLFVHLGPIILRPAAEETGFGSVLTLGSSLQPVTWSPSTRLSSDPHFNCLYPRNFIC